MFVYITRHTLTRGIQRLDTDELVAPNIDEEQGYFSFIDRTSMSNPVQIYHSGEWWLTPESAMKDAEKRKHSEIEAMEKRIQNICQLPPLIPSLRDAI